MKKRTIKHQDCQFAAEKLAEVFPKKAEIEYSVGFQRWQKLTKQQRKALWLMFNLILV